MADLHGTPYTTTVFDIFNAAGYKTFWLSAQFDGQSPGSGVVPIIAHRADSVWSLKSNLPSDKHYDEYMIQKIIDVIDDSSNKKLIVVNILGSHSSYEERIPAHRSDLIFIDKPPKIALFDNFEDHENIAQIINDYDTSILYTDLVVSSIFESLETGTRGAWVAIYLSDHGEEVFDTEKRFGHAGSSTSRNVYEIPFVLKISPEYESWLSEAGILTLDTNRPYQTDNSTFGVVSKVAETEIYRE